MNPYLTDRAAIDALVGAAGRQVKVRLILPAKADKPAVGGAMRHHYGRMIEAGIEIWEFPAVAHAKVLVRDDESVMIGSLNLDALSLRRNPELQLQLEDSDTSRGVDTRLVRARHPSVPAGCAQQECGDPGMERDDDDLSPFL